MTIYEAVKLINDNKEIDAIKELTEQHPLFALAVARNDVAMMAKLLGGELTIDSLTSDNDAEEEKPQKSKDENVMRKTTKADKKSLEDMSVKELIELCESKGIKVVMKGRNKQYYIDKINGAKPKKEEDVKTDSDDWGDEEETKDPYEGKTGKELYRMCKERGIKVEIKKPAKEYADLLREDDNKQNAEEDDDWGEEEDGPKNKESKGGKDSKVTKVSSDDEWDI